MNSPIYSMCVINKIRTTPNATPRQIYEHFYREIQKKQLEEILILKHPLDLIDKAIRKINVVTEDPVEKAYIIKTINILQLIERDIREHHAKPGAELLTALDTVFKYKC